MKNLVEALCAAGFSPLEANASVHVLQQWLEAYYPVTAALAKATHLTEVDGNAKPASPQPSD